MHLHRRGVQALGKAERRGDERRDPARVGVSRFNITMSASVRTFERTAASNERRSFTQRATIHRVLTPVQTSTS